MTTDELRETASTERKTRRNTLLLICDLAAFNVGTTFLGGTTIMPGLVRALGGGPLIVGSLSAIQSGGWMLPQLVAGRYTANRPKVMKYILIPCGTGRALMALYALVLALLGVRLPKMALAGLLLALTAFWVADALTSVPWFDLVAKAIPIERRGRAMGISQSLSSLLGIGVGVLVSRIMARPAAFPANNVLLIVLASACFGASYITLLLIREPAGVTQSEKQPSWGEYIPRLGAILRHDPRFVWFTIVNWLGGLADMGAAFYVLFAADRLHIPLSDVGLFISAGVVGSLLSGIVLGPVGDRRGAGTVITIVMALRCLGPLLALCAPLLATLHPLGGIAALSLVFAAGGIAGGAMMTGFMNYLLEIAPAHERPTYTGLANTLNGVVVLAPLLAGWLVQAASYEVLFSVSLCMAVLGLLVALRRPRIAQPAPAIARE